MQIRQGDLKECISYTISKLPIFSEIHHNERYSVVQRKISTNYTDLCHYLIVCLQALRASDDKACKILVSLLEPLWNLEILYYDYSSNKSFYSKHKILETMQPYIPEIKSLIARMRGIFSGSESEIEELMRA